jgi:hypothetical protein
MTSSIAERQFNDVIKSTQTFATEQLLTIAQKNERQHRSRYLTPDATFAALGHSEAF